MTIACRFEVDLNCHSLHNVIIPLHCTSYNVGIYFNSAWCNYLHHVIYSNEQLHTETASSHSPTSKLR